MERIYQLLKKNSTFFFILAFSPLLPIRGLFILLPLLPPCWVPLQKMGRWDGAISRHCGPPPPPAPPPLLHLQHVDWGQTSINNLKVLRLLSRNLCRARRRLIEELLPGKSINAAEEQRRHKSCFHRSFFCTTRLSTSKSLPRAIGGSSLAPPRAQVSNYGSQARFGPPSVFAWPAKQCKMTIIGY